MFRAERHTTTHYSAVAFTILQGSSKCRRKRASASYPDGIIKWACVHTVTKCELCMQFQMPYECVSDNHLSLQGWMPITWSSHWTRHRCHRLIWARPCARAFAARWLGALPSGIRDRCVVSIAPGTYLDSSGNLVYIVLGIVRLATPVHSWIWSWLLEPRVSVPVICESLRVDIAMVLVRNALGLNRAFGLC